MSIKQATPLSDATNVLELLDDVKLALAVDPRLANMKHYRERTYEDNAPLCGTTGCMAGWICMMAKGDMGNPYASGDEATRIMGEDLKYRFRGSDGKMHDFFNAGAGDRCARTRPGSIGHASAVIDRIDRFIKINGKQKLAARPLNKGNR